MEEGCANPECKKLRAKFGSECDGSDDEHTHCIDCSMYMCLICPVCEERWKFTKCPACMGYETLFYNNQQVPLTMCAMKCWEFDISSSE
jgi:hypothetical protein